jgi:hypothetical protein
METFLGYLYVFGAILFVVVVSGILYAYRGVRKEIENALKNADTKEQEIIRRKVVKAMFPPRFFRD